MIDFVGKKQWFFLISWILLITGIASLIISQIQLGTPLRLGTDFAGGTSMTLQFSPAVEQSRLREEMTKLGYDKATIQNAGEGTFIIHVTELTSEQAHELAGELGAALDSEVKIGDYYLASPTVGAKAAQSAVIAVIVASIAMLFYIIWAFRRMPKSFRWGSCAVIALVHDVLITVGLFSLLGLIAGVEIDALFITALLTIVGYSINNIVVVFDRIRENKARGLSSDFALTVNSSIVETVGRCLNTSLTTIFVILALFLFGGATIHYFVLVLLVGVVVGTYDSICVAGPLLVVWEKGEWSSLLPWTKRPASSS
ncbi:MAG: protein-export membrane protein SecF [Chloroflexi bacterium RBG_13_51_36]|nr:MAG: protein-export membrane protein SecF [Chloroflexi bacterium RBG_13_51_36]